LGFLCFGYFGGFGVLWCLGLMRRGILLLGCGWVCNRFVIPFVVCMFVVLGYLVCFRDFGVLRFGVFG